MGQETRGEGGGFRPGVALEVRLLAREDVAEGGADGLVEAAIRASGESSFGEVAVMYVAGEDQDGGRWGASPPATRWIRSTIAANESWKEAQWSRSSERWRPSAQRAAWAPQAPEHSFSSQLWRWCIVGPSSRGSEVPRRRWSNPPVALSSIHAHSSASTQGTTLAAPASWNYVTLGDSLATGFGAFKGYVLR